MKTIIAAIIAVFTTVAFSACNTCEQGGGRRYSHRAPVERCESIRVDVEGRTPATVEQMRQVANEAARRGGSDSEIEQFCRQELGDEISVRIDRGNGRGGQMGRHYENDDRVYRGRQDQYDSREGRFSNRPPGVHPDSVYGSYRVRTSVSGNPVLENENLEDYYEGMRRSGTPVYVSAPRREPVPWGERRRGRY